MLVMGTISIATEDGVSTMNAPYNVVSKPHVKRIAYAHTDSIWVTFHVTQLTDVEEIERLVIMPESEYLALATSEEAAKLANLKESKEAV
jgi:hypothetical protein